MRECERSAAGSLRAASTPARLHMHAHPFPNHPRAHGNAQERFFFGDAVLPLFESGIPLLLERLQKLPDHDNVSAPPLPPSTPPCLCSLSLPPLVPPCLPSPCHIFPVFALPPSPPSLPDFAPPHTHNSDFAPPLPRPRSLLAFPLSPLSLPALPDLPSLPCLPLLPLALRLFSSELNRSASPLATIDRDWLF
eukprot:329963-Chlamydomonas_euryale.AAC.2